MGTPQRLLWTADAGSTERLDFWLKHQVWVLMNVRSYAIQEEQTCLTSTPIAPGIVHMNDIVADADDIRNAYRLLLGREPDVFGFSHFMSRAKSGSLTLHDLVASIIGSPEFLGKNSARPVEVELDGFSIFVREDDQDIGGPIIKIKEYEPHVTQAVHEFLKESQTFVDVGANIGFFTSLAAHIVGPNGKVIAIEPLDKNLQLIYASIWKNGFGWVDVLPFAASDANVLLPMETRANTSNGQVVLGGSDDHLPIAFAPARRLDELLAGEARVHLLKIDIEGHELVALRAFKEGLARHRPLVLTEFHPKCMRENSKIDPLDYLRFLFDYGDAVRVLRHDGAKTECRDAEAVMREWEQADRRLNSNGTTHLDLFVRPRV